MRSVLMGVIAGHTRADCVLAIPSRLVVGAGDEVEAAGDIPLFAKRALAELSKVAGADRQGKYIIGTLYQGLAANRLGLPVHLSDKLGIIHRLCFLRGLLGLDRFELLAA